MIPIKTRDLMLAAQHGKRAMRNGDLVAAERWFKLAERAADVAKRLRGIAHVEALQKAPNGPVKPC